MKFYLKMLVGAVLLSSAFAAFGQTLITRQGNDWVRITDKPCTNEKVLAVIEANEPWAKDEFVAATGMFSGRLFQACAHPSGATLHIFYEDGDQGLILDSDLKEDLGV